MKSLFYSIFIFCLSLGYIVFSQNVSSIHKTTADCKISASGGLGCALSQIKISSTPVLDSGDNVSSYAWSGPANFTSSVQNPMLMNASTNQSGVYTVKMVTANACTAIATTSVLVENCLKLGDLVWNDTNNNGKRDATETGLSGVTIRLYTDNNADEKPDGTALAVTVNDANGKYLFTNLSPGKYIVEATPPTGYRSSTGINGSETGPYEGNSPGDNDVDNDDNGTGNPVRSRTITLNNFTESITDGDTDNNSNLTVDFGFYQYDIAPADLSTQCTDNTVKLKAIGGSTYAWKGPNNFVSTQQNPILKNVNYRNRGIYTVTIDNTATFTTEVNIKDPVAFTVPKEISVCEGGTLWINPQKKRLTDSTEVPGYFNIFTPSGTTLNGGSLRNFNLKDAGIYKVEGGIYDYESSNSCTSTQLVSVKINTSINCKSIEIEDLSKVKVCYGQEVIIPFTTKGEFKVGTRFKVYIIDYSQPTYNKFDVPVTVVDKSPVVLKNLDKYNYVPIAIAIVADDFENTYNISTYKRIYSNSEYVNNTINSIQTCDSSKLSTYYPKNINSVQWYLNGSLINGATNKDFIAKINGTYSFRFKGNIIYNEIDKTCIHESTPIKIELGKIDKPSVYISNNIELCVGKPATLNLSSSKANTNYRWKKDGNYITNATKSVYETLQEGKYQIEAKEGTCTAVSDTVVLKKPERLQEIYLNPLLSPSNSFIDYSERGKGIYKMCENQTYGLYVSLGRYNFTTPPKIQWIRDNNLLQDTLSSIPNIKGEGTYLVKATYGTCNGISDNLIVKYSKSLKGTSFTGFGNNIEQCLGTSINIELSSSSSYNKLSKGSIYKDGAVFKDWTIRNNSQSYNYYDYFPINQSGKYYAEGKVSFPDKSECSITTDTITVNFTKKIQENPFTYIPEIKAVPITTCKDTIEIGSYYYSQRGREVAYKWTKDGVTIKQDSSGTLSVTQPGIYQLETSYKGTCSVVTSPYKVQLGKNKVNFKSFESVLSPSGSICEGFSYYLYPYVQESRVGNVWNLYKDGLPINSSLPNTISINQAGVYRVVVTNGKCEGISPDFTLKVDKIPTSITPSDSAVFCDGKTVELKTSTEAGLSYIWERNGSVINQANQATLTASRDGLYKATLLRGTCWGTTPSVKLKTLANIIPMATLSGDKKIDYDQETKLAVNLSSHAPWTFKLSDGKEYTATKSPFEITVKPLSTTTYNLTEVKNICGTGTVSGTAKIEVIILSSEEEEGVNINVYPMPTAEICNWQIQTEQASTVALTLLNMNGQTQIEQSSPIRSQKHTGTIDLSTMKSGTYLLKINVGEKTITRKIVKF